MSTATSPLAMLGKRQPSADRKPTTAVSGFGVGPSAALGSPPRGSGGGEQQGDEALGGRPRGRGRPGAEAAPREVDDEGDLEAERQQAEGKGGKSKDLSHVPCRFFQKGRCEMGDNCHFSHDRGEPGQQKKVCEYFLKGSCRFGHKCALAHLLPGEPISMDRKHKKAAQVGATGQAAFGPASGIAKQAQDAGQRSLGVMATSPPSGNKMPRAPSYSQTVQTGGGKAKRAGGQEPARELPIHGVRREGLTGQSQTGSFPELARSISPNSRHRLNQAQIQANRGDQYAAGSSNRPSALSKVISARGPGDDSEAFRTRPLSVPGPLGSNGRAVSFGFDRSMGQSPSGSQTAIGGDRPSSNPFTAPGSNGLFPSHQDGGPVASSWHPRRPLDLKEGSLAKPVPRPLSTSVGSEFTAPRDIWGERTSSYTGSPGTGGGFLSPARSRPLELLRKSSDTYALDDDDDDDNGEEFLPSSLNELLTPRERARRLSRRDSNHSSGAVGSAMGWSAGLGQQARPITSASSSFDGRTNMELLLSRQAHSASAVVGGFLQNLWDDSGEDARRAKVSTPTTILSGGHASADSLTGPASAGSPDTGFALGPSNNSMGFLPQFGSRAKMGVSSSLLTDQHKALNQPRPSGIASHFPARPSPLTQPSTIDMFADPTFDDDSQRRAAPILHTMSPNAKALQNHAPGQSLPQGLAAGLSRLHLQPMKQHEGISLAQSPAGSTGGGFSPGLEPLRPDVERRTTGLSHTKTRDDIEDDDLFEMER